MILHTLSASPASQAFSDCLRVAAPEDVILLLGDAVYAIIEGSDAHAALLASGAGVHVLQSDAAAAGVWPQSSFDAIDMAGFVSLSEDFPRQQAWY